MLLTYGHISNHKRCASVFHMAVPLFCSCGTRMAKKGFNPAINHPHRNPLQIFIKKNIVETDEVSKSRIPNFVIQINFKIIKIFKSFNAIIYKNLIMISFKIENDLLVRFSKRRFL